ncbi:SapC family protein [Simiduia sp. 21SJ11W-1]|uniref:SapC family protein n=1 Tax=Simiduia sp. 21SJ11W-1 TaxID=2909669 RepID=UPI00209F22C0|nr:SapC family protein [Simiduia sp. 21SJ11W-1]UTA47167.1 SapC family protein [Simiduia sp. 21SJ11W-1]
MPNFELLNKDKHKDIRVITEFGARFGDAVMYAMSFPFEFRSLQGEYPILLHKDMDNNVTYPVALFGFQNGENLYLDEQSWQARYKPLMIRRQPFLIGFQGEQAGGVDNRQRVVSIDMENPRISTTEGELLFDSFGANTPFLDEAAHMLEAIHAGHEHNQKFVAALETYELIESITLDITLNDGSKNQLLGFHFINEEKLQALSGDALADLSQQGFLMPIFMMLASMSNIGHLVDKKNQRDGLS